MLKANIPVMQFLRYTMDGAWYLRSSTVYSKVCGNVTCFEGMVDLQAPSEVHNMFTVPKVIKFDHLPLSDIDVKVHCSCDVVNGFS